MNFRYLVGVAEPAFRRAQRRLREYIDEHGLRPGDPLPSEGALARELGISRISLREATRSLQTLGVIEARHGSGLYVSEFSFQPILDQLPYGLAVHKAALHDVLLVRETLEEGLIETVAKQINPADLDELDALVDEMDRLLQADQSVVEVDKAFHLRLFRPLDNPLVDHLIEIFWVMSDRLRDEGRRPPARVARVHRTIVDALRTGKDLREAVRAHFDDVRSHLDRL